MIPYQKIRSSIEWPNGRNLRLDQITEAGRALAAVERELRVVIDGVSTQVQQELSDVAHAEPARLRAAQMRSEELRAVLKTLSSSIALMTVVSDAPAIQSGIADARMRLRDVNRLSELVLDAATGDLPGLWSKVLLAAQTTGTALPAPVRQYGGLLVAIGSAQSSSDARDALVATAAPLGTWRSRYVPGSSLVTVGGSAGIGFQASNSEPLPSRPISVSESKSSWGRRSRISSASRDSFRFSISRVGSTCRTASSCRDPSRASAPGSL